MKVFAIGASRNIGYHATVALLKQGHSVTYLLRRPEVFDADNDIKPFIDSGKVTIAKGDALVVEDVRKAWQVATADGPVDVIIFSVGGTPSFSITKGFVVTPADLCARSFLHVLSVIPRTAPQPRVVAVTAYGITKTSHSDIPFLVKGLYAMISVPHADKLGMERLARYSGNWPSLNDQEILPDVLPPGWEAELGGQPGWLKSIAVIRPALLTDGVEKGKYRVGERITGVYTISRKDVAHFIVNDVIPNWEKYEGKPLTVGY